jgi:hypothetical protein
LYTPFVGLAGGGDDGALLGPGDVLAVAARVVEALACREDLAGRQGLPQEALVVVCADHLNGIRPGDPGPVANELAHLDILQPSAIEDGINIGHFPDLPS